MALTVLFTLAWSVCAVQFTMAGFFDTQGEWPGWSQPLNGNKEGWRGGFRLASELKRFLILA